MSLTAPPRYLDVAEWMETWESQEDAFELVAGVPTVSPAEAPSTSAPPPPCTSTLRP